MSNKTIVQAKFGGRRLGAGIAKTGSTPSKLEALANKPKTNNNIRPLTKESTSR